MRCAGIIYTKSGNSLAICWQAICENWCQFMLCPRKGEFSCCTKIPEIVILTCSLKLCAQRFKLLLKILPFVSVTASWNLESTQNYGILQLSSYKETPAAKVHSSHDPHSVCTESGEWLAAQMQHSTECMLSEWTWGFKRLGNMRYLSMPLVICMHRSNIWCMSKWSWQK